MDNREREQVMSLSQGERFSYDDSQTWVDLFRIQSRAHRGKIAVVAENGSLSYGDLDRHSGSTGKPKGVVIPQRALTNFVHFIAKRWGIGEHSRIALHSNFAFDAAVEDIFPALTVGECVVLMLRKNT